MAASAESPSAESAPAESGLVAASAGSGGGEAGDKPSGAPGPDAGTGSAAADGGRPQRGPGTEVIVVPGITRYHRSQCILIRFLGPEDLQAMTRQAAEVASYVPCKACRPEEELPGD